MTQWSADADKGGKVSAGVAFNQKDGRVLLKSGFSRDV